MIFELTEKQVKKYEAWAKTIPEVPDSYFSVNGGGMSFTFTPTSLGLLVMVARADGYELDLTEYEHF